jgi:hypothetical protein
VLVKGLRLIKLAYILNTIKSNNLKECKNIYLADIFKMDNKF